MTGSSPARGYFGLRTMPRSKKNSNFYARSGRYITKADQALKVARAVRNLINVEYKSLRTAFGTTDSTTMAIKNLTAVGQGDDYVNREGRKVRAVALSIKGSVVQHASATTTCWRVIVARDNNGSTTTPVDGDLISAANLFDGKNKNDDPQSNARFTVLMDKVIQMSDSGSRRFTVDRYIKLNHHQYFSGTATTDEGKGAIYAFTASTEATNVPTVVIDCIYKFIDN